jgi:hypothetical protein
MKGALLKYLSQMANMTNITRMLHEKHLRREKNRAAQKKLLEDMANAPVVDPGPPKTFNQLVSDAIAQITSQQQAELVKQQLTQMASPSPWTTTVTTSTALPSASILPPASMVRPVFFANSKALTPEEINRLAIANMTSMVDAGLITGPPPKAFYVKGDIQVIGSDTYVHNGKDWITPKNGQILEFDDCEHMWEKDHWVDVAPHPCDLW